MLIWIEVELSFICLILVMMNRVKQNLVLFPSIECRITFEQSSVIFCASMWIERVKLYIEITFIGFYIKLLENLKTSPVWIVIECQSEDEIVTEKVRVSEWVQDIWESANTTKYTIQHRLTNISSTPQTLQYELNLSWVSISWFQL